ncbi:MAG: hypothetical protein V3G42_15975 [Oscillospiraceae bacterium]
MDYRDEEGNPEPSKLISEHDGELTVSEYDKTTLVSEKPITAEEAGQMIQNFLKEENNPFEKVVVESNYEYEDDSGYGDKFVYYPEGDLSEMEQLHEVLTNVLENEGDMFGAQCGAWRFESGVLEQDDKILGSITKSPEGHLNVATEIDCPENVLAMMEQCVAEYEVNHADEKHHDSVER